MDSITVSDMTFNYAFASDYTLYVKYADPPYLQVSIVTLDNSVLYNNYISFSPVDGYTNINMSNPKELYNDRGLPFAPYYVHMLFRELPGD